MHVFMSVQMGRADAGVTYCLNLDVPFFLDFVKNEAAPYPFEEQLFRPACKMAVIVQQTYDGFRIRDGRAVAQIQMYAHTKAGR